MTNARKLEDFFRKFPGIGPRQAKRFVYYLLTEDPHTVRELAESIKLVKENISLCEMSFQYFQKDASSSKTSPIERNANRDRKILMIVPRDADLEHIEKSHLYNGVYFVLGGSVPILERIKKRIEKDGLNEIILAMNLNPEGDNTAQYIEGLLKDLINEHKIKISHLGRGLSTGTELEYSDDETLKNALKNRF